jgi:hypothetical protein
MCVCMYVACVCMHVCMHACMCACMCVCMYVHACVYVCCVYKYVCMHVRVHACMCACMCVCMHVCCAVVYACMHLCMRCRACVYACMHDALSLNVQINRWLGKQGNLVRHYVTVVFGMFPWVCSVCFVGYVCCVRYVSLECRRREQDATNFCSVAFERGCVICDKSPGKEQKLEKKQNWRGGKIGGHVLYVQCQLVTQCQLVHLS